MNNRVDNSNTEELVNFYLGIIRDGKNPLRLIAFDIEDLKNKVKDAKRKGKFDEYDSILIIFSETNEKVFISDINELYERIKILEQEEDDEKILSYIEKENKHCILDVKYSEDNSSILIYTTYRKKALIKKCNVENERRIIRILRRQKDTFYNSEKSTHCLWRNIKLSITTISISIATILLFQSFELPINCLPYILVPTVLIVDYNIWANSKRSFNPNPSPFNKFCDMVERRRIEESKKDYSNKEKTNNVGQRLGPPNINFDTNPLILRKY